MSGCSHQPCLLCGRAPGLKDRDGDGAAARCHHPAPQPPALLQMAGSSGWFANDQVRLKPQSLWLPAAVISHTVSDPIIASPPTPPHFICLKGKAQASHNSISERVYI